MAWSIPKILVTNYGIDVKNGIDHFEPAAMISFSLNTGLI